MTLGMRSRLFLVSLGLIAAAVLVGGLILEVGLVTDLQGRLEADLARRTELVRQALRVGVGRAAEDPQGFVVGLGRAAEARVTLIDGGGRVLADSGVEPVAVPTLPSHRDRPEVQEALRTAQPAQSRRYSATLGVDMLYRAAPCAWDGAPAVVRLAIPLHDMELATARLRWSLLVSALLALAVAAAMSALASHLATRTLRRLIAGARAVADSRGGQRIRETARGEVGGLIGSINLLAEELRRVISDLAGERDLLESVLEGMEDAVLALDEAGRLTHVNRAAATMLRLPADAVGRLLGEVVRAPALHELTERLAREGLVGLEFDLPGPPARRLAALAAPKRSGGAVLVLRDVTELRRLERVRRDFMANASHELRTPVSIIQANAETLLGGVMEEPARARQFLEALKRNADRLGQLLGDLLDLSRLDAGESTLRIETLDPLTAVREVVAGLEEVARRKEIALRVALEAGLACRADARALVQVLWNLADNAIRYIPAGGRVIVSGRRAGDHLRLEVTDDGPGIEARHRDRVFERFYRVDTGRSREAGGTGLGLSIVKHLVEAMGGQVGLEPAEPHGCVFWVQLPGA